MPLAVVALKKKIPKVIHLPWQNANAFLIIWRFAGKNFRCCCCYLLRSSTFLQLSCYQVKIKIVWNSIEFCAAKLPPPWSSAAWWNNLESVLCERCCCFSTRTLKVAFKAACVLVTKPARGCSSQPAVHWPSGVCTIVEFFTNDLQLLF